MVVVEAAYLEHHLAGKTSEAEARRAFRRVNAFMENASRRRSAWRVAEFDLLRQREFIKVLSGQGLSVKYIADILTACASAVNWCARDQIVRDGRGERQVRILTHATTFTTGTAAIAEILDEPEPTGRIWIPTPAEMSGFVDAINDERVWRFTVIALNTWARRGAVFEFQRDMVDFQHGIIRLNPEGRRQTKKRRPTIRLTANLASWLDKWGTDRPIESTTKQHSDITERFRSTAHRIELPKLTPHVLRHYCASRARSLGAPRDEVKEWLGHSKGDTTNIYLHMDPDWLVKCRDATDELVREVGL